MDMEERLLAMSIDDIGLRSQPHKPRDIRTKVQGSSGINPENFWEIVGHCGITLNTCSSLEAARQDAASHRVWEVWQVSLGHRSMVDSNNPFNPMKREENDKAVS